MPPRFDPRKLTPAQQEERIGSAAAKAAMERDKRLSLSHAGAKYNVPGRAILRWFPGSFGRDARGRYVALPDGEIFPMMVVTTRGVRELDVPGSAARHAVGRHHHAIKALLDPDGGDTRPLLAIPRTRIGGYVLETDPDVIEELWLAGELDFLSIYLTESPDEE